MLRAQLEPEQVYVIPNALVADNYAPSPTSPSTDTSESFHSSRQLTPVNIIIMSRLVYRKGIDLLVAAAPQICDLYPQVRFIVGGDGPKMVELEQMREKYQLQDRIELLGSIPPSGVRDVSAGSIRLPEGANARLAGGSKAGRDVDIDVDVDSRCWCADTSTSTRPSPRHSGSASSRRPRRGCSSSLRKWAASPRSCRGI